VQVYPLLNSPPAAGRDGVKAAYKMLRVLSYGQRFDFHSVASDRITVEKGIEKLKLTLDLTEHLKLSFVPLPDRLNPVRFPPPPPPPPPPPLSCSFCLRAHEAEPALLTFTIVLMSADFLAALPHAP